VTAPPSDVDGGQPFPSVIAGVTVRAVSCYGAVNPRHGPHAEACVAVSRMKMLPTCQWRILGIVEAGLANGGPPLEETAIAVSCIRCRCRPVRPLTRRILMFANPDEKIAPSLATTFQAPHPASRAGPPSPEKTGDPVPATVVMIPFTPTRPPGGLPDRR